MACHNIDSPDTTIFSYWVENPQRYGVIEFGSDLRNLNSSALIQRQPSY